MAKNKSPESGTLKSKALTAMFLGSFLSPTFSNQEIEVLPDEKISIQEAIDIAETRENGKAVRAELKRIKDGLLYEVDIQSGVSIIEAFVDAKTGRLVRKPSNLNIQESDEVFVGK